MRVRRWLGSVTAVSALAFVLQGESPVGAADNRNAVSEKLALDVDGVLVGSLKSASGGEAVVEATLSKPTATKAAAAGSTKFNDISLEIGLSAGRQFFHWISEGFAGNSIRHNGAIYSADYDGNVLHVMSFYQALIEEIDLPALDAGSKDAATIKMKIAPEVVRVSNGSSEKLATRLDVVASESVTRTSGTQHANVRQLVSFAEQVDRGCAQPSRMATCDKSGNAQ